MANIYERNFSKAQYLIGDMINSNLSYKKYSAGEAFDPLAIEKIYQDEDGRWVYGMMHYYIQNGDLMKDPDITFAVDAEGKTLEALTFENSALGIYQEVYVYRDGRKMFSPSLKKDLNEFLNQWFSDIKNNGYKLVESH